MDSDVTFLGEMNDNGQLVAENLRDVGFTYFSYARAYDDKIIQSYFTSPEWASIYKAKNYTRFDPLFRGVVCGHHPLLIWDAVRPTGEAGRVMAERNEVCRLRSGITIGINQGNISEVIALGSPVSPRELYDLLRDSAYTQHVRDLISSFYRVRDEKPDPKKRYEGRLRESKTVSSQS